MSESDETKLAVRQSGSAPDAYEEKYMPGEGLVLHRVKQRAPWQLSALMGMAAVGLVVSSVAPCHQATSTPRRSPDREPPLRGMTRS